MEGEARCTASTGRSEGNWGDLERWPRTDVGGTSCDISHSHEGACGRVANGMEKGNLSAKLKAEIAWVAARNDRAWYALAIARDRLKRNGFTDDQVFALDGDRRNLPETEQAALALVETLTVSPWKVTDEMVGAAGSRFGTRKWRNCSIIRAMLHSSIE